MDEILMEQENPRRGRANKEVFFTGPSASYDDFIGMWDTSYDGQELIDYWNLCNSLGATIPRRSFGADPEDNKQRSHMGGGDGYMPLSRTDSMVTLNPDSIEYITSPNVPIDAVAFYGYLRSLNELISQCLTQYIDQFEGLSGYELNLDCPNIQRTKPTEGYHAWHCEDAGYGVGKRVLAYMLYLNDDFDGGETEWLYQKRREAPTEGRMVIWPAGWTHVHRGLPPLNGEKYIVTGWVSTIRG